MATVAVERQLSQESWDTRSSQSRPRFHYAPPVTMPQPMLPEPSIPPRNDIELTRERLIDVLNYFSQLLVQPFMNLPVRLVVHGGACMLLHPGLYKLSLQQHQLSPTMPRRTTTRDVDYIKRSFAAEWSQAGLRDATERLQECIMATAHHFRLGADWMNSDADIALPMATDPTGKQYDPIYAASVQQNNIDLHTIYTSPNGLLTLISVTPFWAVSLKLVRYAKWDPGDICLLLRNGTILSGTKWTTEMLENWLYNYCSPMGYANYDAQRKKDLRTRMLHAIQLVSNWTAMINNAPERKVSANAAMGGGEVGEHGQPGWKSTFGPWPVQAQVPDHKEREVHHQVLLPHTSEPQIQRSSSSSMFLSPPNVQDWMSKRSGSRSRQSSPQPPDNRTNPRQENMFIPPDAVDPQSQWRKSPNLMMPNIYAPRDRDSSSEATWSWWEVHDLRSRRTSQEKTANSNDGAWNHHLHHVRSVEQFDYSLGSMLHNGRGSVVGAMPGAPKHMEGPVIPIIPHQKREKKSSKSRDQKWHIVRDPTDTESASDEENDPMRRGRPSIPHTQSYSPPSAWRTSLQVQNASNQSLYPYSNTPKHHIPATSPPNTIQRPSQVQQMTNLHQSISSSLQQLQISDRDHKRDSRHAQQHHQILQHSQPMTNSLGLYI